MGVDPINEKNVNYRKFMATLSKFSFEEKYN